MDINIIFYICIITLLIIIFILIIILLITSKDTNIDLMKTLGDNLEKIRSTNEKKLDTIEGHINEKLDKSLNERLDKSFELVGNQLQNLSKNIGELQSLSSGVNDLQKTLSNVKTRGVFGEKQLENILENILGNSHQWDKQYRINDDEDRRVDFVIKIPNKDDNGELYLPIDAKFPSDMYNKIVDASRKGSESELQNAIKELKSAIQKQAQSIRDKYICPPITTDFALMYLPTEGLYSECLRIDGLTEDLQNKYKVILVGPTTVTAIINSFSVGFKYLKISKSSAEINKILQAIKAQYEKFGDEIENTKEKIRQAGDAADKLEKRNEIINKRLKNVVSLEQSEADKLLELE